MTQDLYVAGWEPAPGEGWSTCVALSTGAYEAEFDRLVGHGLRPACVSGYEVDGEVRHAALFTAAAGGGWVARHDLTGDAYGRVHEALGARGYRPTGIGAYTVAGEPRFAAVWQKAEGPAWEARHGLTAQELQTSTRQAAQAGLRLRSLATYAIDGEDRYAAVWDASGGPIRRARLHLDAPGFASTSRELAGRGFRLLAVDACTLDGRDLYAALWELDPRRVGVTHHAMTVTAFRRRSAQLAADGLRPTLLAAFAGAQPLADVAPEPVLAGRSTAAGEQAGDPVAV